MLIQIHANLLKNSMSPNIVQAKYMTVWYVYSVSLSIINSKYLEADVSRSRVVFLGVPVFYLRGGVLQHQVSGGRHHLTVLLDETGNDHPDLIVLYVVWQSVLYWGQLADHCTEIKNNCYTCQFTFSSNIICFKTMLEWCNLALQRKLNGTILDTELKRSWTQLYNIKHETLLILFYMHFTRKNYWSSVSSLCQYYDILWTKLKNLK